MKILIREGQSVNIFWLKKKIIRCIVALFQWRSGHVSDGILCVWKSYHASDNADNEGYKSFLLTLLQQP
jgi:hypothetical protein